MELACRADEASLDSLINMAIQINNLLQDRFHRKRSPALITSSEPMQLGNTHLMAAERLRRSHEGLYF